MFENKGNKERSQDIWFSDPNRLEIDVEWGCSKTAWQEYRQFRENFSQDVEYEKLGWKPVPRIHGTCLSSWGLIEKIFS